MGDLKIPNLPAFSANSFNVSASPTDVKVTLGQMWFKDGEIAWAQAFTLTHTNARWLCDAIEKSILHAENEGLKK